MRNLNPFIYITQREFSQPRFWLYIAVVWLVFFTAVRISSASDNDTKTIPISLIDEDNTEISTLVIERIRKNEFVDLKEFEDPMRALMRWQIDGLFVLKQGFGEKLLRGEKDGLIDFYYPPSYVVPEIVGEVVTKEVMRIYVTHKAAGFIQNEYGKHGLLFDKALEREILAHTDSFWNNGDTITIDVHYLDTDLMTASSTRLKNLVISIVLSALLMFIALSAGIPLAAQKENGVFTRLSGCNVPLNAYVAYSVMFPVTVSLSAPLFFFGINNIAYGLYMLWCGLIAVFIVCVTRRVYSYFLILALMPLLLTFFAGVSAYLGESSEALQYIGRLNPIYCVTAGDSGYLTMHLSVIILSLILITKIHKNPLLFFKSFFIIL